MIRGQLIIASKSQLFGEGLKAVLITPLLMVSRVRSITEALAALRSGEQSADILVADLAAEANEEFVAMGEITRDFSTVSIVVMAERMES